MKRDTMIRRFFPFIIALFAVAAPLTSCSSQQEPEPLIRTTAAPEPQHDSIKPQQKKQKNQKQQKKPKIQSFSKHEPVWV